MNMTSEKIINLQKHRVLVCVHKSPQNVKFTTAGQIVRVVANTILVII